jgi:hypothetical protein
VLRIRIRPALIADGLGECQVRWPEFAIVFWETRPLAEEWTDRYLAAARVWATTEPASIQRIAVMASRLETPHAPGEIPEIRASARANGIAVPQRGRLPADVCEARLAAHPDD